MKKANSFVNMKLCISNKNCLKIVIISIIIISVILLSIFAVSSRKYSKHIYNAGDYFGTGEGYHSSIEVKVTTDDYKILDISIINHKEMPVISEVVFKEIPFEVIRENGTKVDIVSGATQTSEGLIEAIDNALSKAIYAKSEVH